MCCSEDVVHEVMNTFHLAGVPPSRLAIQALSIDMLKDFKPKVCLTIFSKSTVCHFDKKPPISDLYTRFLRKIVGVPSDASDSPT